jgi:hypothetical protein
MRRMIKESQRDTDLKEIFSHIEQLKLEREQVADFQKEELEPVEIIKDNGGITAGELDNIPPEDIFEIVRPADEFSEKTVSKMKVDVNSAGTCDICRQKIDFEKNLSGLVIQDSFFACEKCCQDVSKDELNNWTESKMASPKDVKPIALWLMQEKNKTQLFEK